MDPFALQALLDIFFGLGTNGLVEVAGRAWDSRRRPGDKNAIDSAVRGAVGELTDVEAILPSLGGEQLRAFLQSPETRNVVRQIFASESSRSRSEIAQEFYALWRLRAGDGADGSQDSLERLFESLVRLCDRSLDKAIEAGSLTALEARQARRHAEIQGSIESLGRTLRVLDGTPRLDPREIDRYATKYRSVLATRTGTITPPALDAARRVPAEQLYVDRRLEELGGTAPHTTRYPGFVGTFFRCVIVGDPGAGKTTLVRRLTSDLASGKVTLGRRSHELVPFLVSSREFGLRKHTEPCSIVDFIASTSNSEYQTPVPAGAIEYLLLTDRALVIFDGLDELLDTHHRAKVAGDIESFATLYPATPILVTCREEAYARTPLSAEAFKVFRLSTFSERQAEQYARMWFSIEDGDAVGDRVARFMEESQSVSDLRSNAFMLALMCSLYRDSGRIPPNRPAVYEACAKMAFYRWDEMREIGEPSAIESLRLPALQQLAAWIYVDEARQDGVTERQLVGEATKFLHARRFERVEDARLEAERFVDHCLRRAQVFTDIGVSATGEALYRFSHRTFLEFFTAAHLVEAHPTAEKLRDALAPHISAGEWNVVSELALQILTRESGVSAEEAMVVGLAEAGAEPDEQAEENRLDFAVRNLEQVVPSPEVAADLAARALAGLMRFSAADAGTDDGPIEGLPVRTALALFKAAAENAAPIRDVLVEQIGDYLSDPATAPFAAEFALNLKLYDGVPGDPEERSLAETTTRRMVEAHADALRAAEASDRWVGTDLVLEGLLDPERYVSAHGAQPLLALRSYRLFAGSFRSPVAEIAVGSLLWEFSSAMSVESSLGCLAALADHLNPSGLADLGTFFANGSWIMDASNSAWPTRDLEPRDFTADQRYAFVVLLGMFFEDSLSAGSFHLHNMVLPESEAAEKSSMWAAALPVLSGRSPQKDQGKAIMALERLGLSETQHRVLREWIEGRTWFSSVNRENQSRKSSSSISAS